MVVSLIGMALYTKFGWLGMGIWFGAVSLGAIMFLKPNLVLPIYLFSIGITLQLPETLHRVFSYGLTALLSVVYILSRTHRGTAAAHARPDRALIWFVAIYAFWSLTSSLFSDHLAYSLFITLRILVFFWVIYIFFDWTHDRRNLGNMFLTIVMIGTIASFFVFFEFLSIGTIISGKDVIRYSGIFGNVNSLGTVLSFAIPISLFSIHLAPKRTGKAGLILAFILMSFSLFLTFSRASWLSTGISCLLILLYFRTSRIVVLGLLSLMSFVVMASSELRELAVVLLRLEGSITHRDIMWESALRIMNDHPLLGTGPNTIELYLFKYTGLDITTWFGGIVATGAVHAHNFFLNMGAELGYPGVVIAGSVFVLFYSYFAVGLKRVHDPKDRTLLIASGAMVTGSLGRSIFEGNAILTGGWLSFDIYFWLIIVATVHIVRKHRSILEDPRRQ